MICKISRTKSNNKMIELKTLGTLLMKHWRVMKVEARSRTELCTLCKNITSRR